MKAKKTPVIRAEKMKPRALKKATTPYGKAVSKNLKKSVSTAKPPVIRAEDMKPRALKKMTRGYRKMVKKSIKRGM